MTTMRRVPRPTVLASVLTAALIGALAMLLVGLLLPHDVAGGNVGQPAQAGPVIPVWTTTAPSAGWNPTPEENYLAELRDLAPGLWDAPEGPDDASLVALGHKGCELAEVNEGSWAEGVSILVDNGYDAGDVGVWVFESQRFLCPSN